MIKSQRTKFYKIKQCCHVTTQRNENLKQLMSRYGNQQVNETTRILTRIKLRLY